MARKCKILMGYVLSFLFGNITCNFMKDVVLSDKGKVKDEKDKIYNRLFHNWLLIIERGNGIEEYFYEKGIKEIAVYGYGNIGRHLVEQLIKTDISIKYIIDKNKKVVSDNIDVYHLTEKIPDVDAVIVTPICEYQSIKKKIENKVSGEIISMEDIIYELM